MDQWVKDLWNKNKILFFLLVPLVALAFFRSAIINILLKDSRKIEADTENKDRVLSAQEADAKARADQLAQDATNAGKDKPAVDENWNKK